MRSPAEQHLGSVACLGEALVLLPALPDEADTRSPATDAPVGPPVAGTLAGAEANVAAALAAMGVPASWIGRLGADWLGDLLYADLKRHGVDVSAVQRDPDRPTGSYAKLVERDEHGEPSTRVRYRRASSAASAMGPELLDEPHVDAVLSRATVIHTSGINPALSASCAQLMRALLHRAREWDAQICFDVNWREQLWPGGDPSTVVELAGLADTVLVGADEAIRVFGTDDPTSLRAMLPGPELLIVKDGARRAVAVARDGTVVEEPALSVEVVEPVGAGDAFAAGFLAGRVRGEETRRCLRRGHLSAAVVLTVTGDSAAADLAGVQHLLNATPAEWAAAIVTASGVTTRTPDGADR
ncbi:MAG TPA: sugar kinase [Marmoricola sp.]|nr:sugar kinase [Marmoricola sp.]